jgi:hypothetical protein
MLCEHIIEPQFLIELAKSRRNCKDFQREFTKPSPRVVGFFPKLKKFRKLVLKNQDLNVGELEKIRLIELLDIVKGSGFDHEEEFNGSLPFMENLSSLDVEPVKHTCLLESVNDNKILKAKTITINDFEHGVNPLVSQILVPKTVDEMSTALCDFFRLSSEITIVDPYFSSQPGTWKTFLALIEKSVTNSPITSKSITVLFDGNKKSARSCQYLMDKFKQENLPFIDKNLQLIFKDISENWEEAIHNRYVISELACCILPYGIQETNDSERDEFTLCNQNIYNIRYKQYVELHGFLINDQISLW